MTEKLFEKDAYIKEFDATVLDCVSDGDSFKVVLDKTAFFYEGGGQASDIGFLNESRVFDVQVQNGVIYHYTDKPFEKGMHVYGKIDFERRFSFMQNHTGEHIVSGIAHRLFGVDNVGFHLGEDFATLDFDKELTRKQLNEIEYISNQKVWSNLPVRAYYPTKTELKNTYYRSKKEIDGAVRLVDIKDTDICACCAPHVKSTGEIGIIKLLDTEKMRGGIRILLKCGSFALGDYRTKYENVAEISALLSAKQENSAQAVNLLNEKFSAERQKNAELKRKISELVTEYADNSSNCIFLEDSDIKDLQLAADKLYKKFGGIRAVFLENEKNYSFAICGDPEKLNSVFTDFKSRFEVKGGGRNSMVQGSVCGDKENIKLFFEF